MTEGLSRRQLFTAGALGAGALGVGAAAGFAAGSAGPAAAETFGEETLPFYGRHQNGITALQAHAVLLGFNLREEVDAEHLRRMMRLLTDDAARLTSGRAPLAD